MEILVKIIFALLFASAATVMAKNWLIVIRHYMLRCTQERRLILPKLTQAGLVSAIVAIVLLLAYVMYQSLNAVNETTVKGHEVGLLVHVMRYAFFGAMGIFFVKTVWQSISTLFYRPK